MTKKQELEPIDNYIKGEVFAGIEFGGKRKKNWLYTALKTLVLVVLGFALYLFVMWWIIMLVIIFGL